MSGAVARTFYKHSPPLLQLMMFATAPVPIARLSLFRCIVWRVCHLLLVVVPLDRCPSLLLAVRRFRVSRNSSEQRIFRVRDALFLKKSLGDHVL